MRNTPKRCWRLGNDSTSAQRPDDPLAEIIVVPTNGTTRLATRAAMRTASSWALVPLTGVNEIDSVVAVTPTDA